MPLEMYLYPIADGFARNNVLLNLKSLMVSDSEELRTIKSIIIVKRIHRDKHFVSKFQSGRESALSSPTASSF